MASSIINAGAAQNLELLETFTYPDSGSSTVEVFHNFGFNIDDFVKIVLEVRDLRKTTATSGGYTARIDFVYYDAPTLEQYTGNDYVEGRRELKTGTSAVSNVSATFNYLGHDTLAATDVNSGVFGSIELLVDDSASNCTYSVHGNYRNLNASTTCTTIEHTSMLMQNPAGAAAINKINGFYSARIGTGFFDGGEVKIYGLRKA